MIPWCLDGLLVGFWQHSWSGKKTGVRLNPVFSSSQGRAEVWFWNHTVLWRVFVWPQGSDLGCADVREAPVEPVMRPGNRGRRGQRAGFAPLGFCVFRWPRVWVGVSLLLNPSRSQRIPLSNLKLNYMLMSTCLAQIMSHMCSSNVDILD